MVEGLKAGRPLVKFRRALPVAALLFVAASTYRYYHAVPRTLLLPGGVTFVSRPGTPPATVATATNLPAIIFAAPVEMIFNSPQSRYHDVFRIVEFSLLGVIFWFAAGRFFDDVIAWRAVRSGSRWRLSDCLMAALVAAEATVVLAIFALKPGIFPNTWFLISGVGWAMLGYSAFFFRILQYRAYPRTKRRPDPD